MAFSQCGWGFAVAPNEDGSGPFKIEVAKYMHGKAPRLYLVISSKGKDPGHALANLIEDSPGNPYIAEVLNRAEDIKRESEGDKDNG